MCEIVHTAATTSSAASGASAEFYETRTGPEQLRWFWALHFPGTLRTDNRAGSLEAAKEEFEECWRKWKAWAKLEEVP